MLFVVARALIVRFIFRILTYMCFVALDLSLRLVCAHLFYCCLGCSKEMLLVLFAIGKSLLLFSTRTLVVVRAHVLSFAWKELDRA